MYSMSFVAVFDEWGRYKLERFSDELVVVRF